MEILDSLEARWFFTTADAGARAWFASISPEGSRTDDYLLTGRADLGFKARAVAGTPRKVETKYLLGVEDLVELAPGVTAKLERLRKLSLPVEDENLKKNGSWVSVAKIRRLRRFAFDGEGVAEVSSEDLPRAGCGVELTELSCRAAGAPERAAWTLALEAFGPGVDLLDVLRATCRAAVASGLRFDASAGASMSYPAWLSATFGS